MPGKRLDLTGLRFGNLIALRDDGCINSNGGKKIRAWLFRCDCGGVCRRAGAVVARGRIKSCGCLYGERSNSEECSKYKKYISGARIRDLAFSISVDTAAKLFLSPCHYCGGLMGLNGIDRVDNSVGYIDGNCVACCSICNRAKNVMTENGFISMCVAVAKRHGQKQATA